MSVALRDLEAKFIASTPDGWRIVEDRGQAQGVKFLCPLCFNANGGPVGTHIVVCWGPAAPADKKPGPGRWTLVGDSIDTLTLGEVPGKTRSVLLMGGCGWHGFITNGVATL